MQSPRSFSLGLRKLEPPFYIQDTGLPFWNQEPLGDILLLFICLLWLKYVKIQHKFKISHPVQGYFPVPALLWCSYHSSMLSLNQYPFLVLHLLLLFHFLTVVTWISGPYCFRFFCFGFWSSFAQLVSHSKYFSDSFSLSNGVNRNFHVHSNPLLLLRGGLSALS